MSGFVQSLHSTQDNDSAEPDRQCHYTVATVISQEHRPTAARESGNTTVWALHAGLLHLLTESESCISCPPSLAVPRANVQYTDFTSLETLLRLHAFEPC